MLEKHHEIRAFFIGNIVHNVILIGKVLHIDPATGGPGVVRCNDGNKFILKQRGINKFRILVALGDGYVNSVVERGARSCCGGSDLLLY